MMSNPMMNPLNQLVSSLGGSFNEAIDFGVIPSGLSEMDAYQVLTCLVSA